MTIDATAPTATSNDSGSWPSGCTSSTTAARERQRASFWRIMRSPVRAVERQCTRRRSSPSSYSRSVRNSSPRSLTIARGAGRSLSPATRLPTATGATMSSTRGRTSTSLSATLGSTRRARPNGSVAESDSGPTRYRPRRRVGTRYAARAVAPPASGGTRKRAARRPSSNQSVATSSGLGVLAAVLDPEVDPAVGADRGADRASLAVAPRGRGRASPRATTTPPRAARLPTPRG